MAPLTLLSLNQDVLSEILQIILLDTPRELHRTSILRTCSSLHILGLPHLYRVVDPTGYMQRISVLTHWLTLFGEEGGLLKEERGLFVRELRLGQEDPFVSRPVDFPFAVSPTLNLPNCSSLVLDLTSGLDSDSYPPLPTLLHQLPLTYLCVRYDSSLRSRAPLPYGFSPTDFGPTESFGHCPLQVVGVSEDPQPWKRLKTLEFDGCIWHDEVGPSESWYKTLSFADWEFETLVVRLEDFEFPNWEEVEMVGLFLGVKEAHRETFLRRTKRVEFRLHSKVMEEEFRKEVAKRESKGGLSKFEKRIASLIVFIDKEGTERRLLEAEITS